MKIYGIDFTSAPRGAKPITCAVCSISANQLVAEDVWAWTSFQEFEQFLEHEGPWTAAVDFPIGQPRRLVEALDWPMNWSEYIELVGSMTKQEFADTIDAYRAGQPPGDKHHLRQTDKQAGSCSPMMLYGVPVARMFFEGAPRLLHAGVSVWPCRPNDSARVVVEGYPALVARSLVGKRKYKSEQGDTTEQKETRVEILTKLQSQELRASYGISLHCPPDIEQRLCDDAKGDRLDALLCAVQAAAFQLLIHKFTSIPTDASSLEGWIADPNCVSRD